MDKKKLNVQRHELKFYISSADYEYAKKILDELMNKDEHQKNNDGYFIRSLYFDDIMESSLEEKLDGVEKRDKYRIRVYGTNLDWAKLERKRKLNNYVKKDSVTISKKEVYKMINGDYDFLLQKESKIANDFFFDLKRKYFRPVVLIDYFRDVYKMDYNEIRITFDKNIRSSTENFDVFDSEIITNPIQRSDTIIMEVKFNNALPSWFKDFLSFDSAICMAISKYVQSRMHIKNFYSY